MKRIGSLLTLLLVLLAAGCMPAGPVRPQEPGAPTAPQPAEPGRTLQIATRVEAANLSLKVPTAAASATSDAVKRLFNAYLALSDERGIAHPYLAEDLPQLNTDSWRVFPDGRMETVYRLRPDLVWHDGTPLTAEDFAFAYRAYRIPTLGFRPSPQDQIEEVVATDARTITIRWKQLYPDAGALVDNALPPLPRHILEPVLSDGAEEAFLNHPYWTTEYVGLGPYRLTRWEPGGFLDAVAFDRHVGGPPRIGRVRVVYASDPNTVVANLLSKAVDIAVDDSIRFQQGAVLRRQWEADSAGRVLLSPNVTRYIQVQYRPDVVTPRALLDLRVRKALMHAIDRPSLTDALLEGQGDIAETIVSSLMGYYPALEQQITKYPYDPRRTEQLLAEAGMTRQGDGFYTLSAGERFAPSLRSVAGGQEEQEATILVDGFRRVGIDASATVLTAAQSRDGEALASFPALASAQTTLAEDTVLTKFRTARIPTAANRWTGSNLGGYSNPEYDRLYDVFSAALDRAERDQAMIRLMALVSEDLPGLPLYYNPRVVAHGADLQGPRAGGDTFNVYEWAFKS